MFKRVIYYITLVINAQSGSQMGDLYLETAINFPLAIRLDHYVQLELKITGHGSIGCKPSSRAGVVWMNSRHRVLAWLPKP